MSLSIAFLLFTLALIVVVFWAVRKVLGLLFAIAASIVTFVCMAAVFIILATVITSRM